jgi:hypothetical protein
MAKAEEDLPVAVPDFPERAGFIRNLITFEKIQNIVGSDEENKGLVIDLGDKTLQGKIYSGPYPYEAGDSDYDYMRFRASSSLSNGTGVVPISYFYKSSKYDANEWLTGGVSSATPTVGYRLDLLRIKDDKVKHLGFYDGLVSFNRSEDGQFTKLPTIIDGPYMTMLRSDDPSSVVIALETDKPCSSMVYVLERGKSFFKTFETGKKATKHEIALSGLTADTGYAYLVECRGPDGEMVRSNLYNFQTAPEKGQGEVILAFSSDSREGVGGGERTYMGVNFRIMSQISADAYRRGADLFIFGGDLINGYTSETEDFRLQLIAWKKAMAGFWRTKPVYTAMGNHEVLQNVYDDGSKYGLRLDKWPYTTDSAEAVFAEQLYNPINGPEPSDPRRPTYNENVHYVQYGTVLAIAFNNNYWYTTNKACETYGGSPEGYMMEDQLEWIEDVLTKAEVDPTVKFILLYAQEPVFPGGGHVKDSMWWHGNNGMRAYTKNMDGVVEPEALGMIEVRNRFWKAIAQSSKVAAVLTGDEHEYHRILISSETPVGVYPADDKDGDGKLDEQSPNPEFTHPTWHLTVGTAGAPFYSREKTPWDVERLTSHHGYTLFETNGDKISMKFIGITTGEVLDEVGDLMAVKARH